MYVYLTIPLLGYYSLLFYYCSGALEKIYIKKSHITVLRAKRNQCRLKYIQDVTVVH